MNSHDPMRRFLGLEPSADPFKVLGLEPDQLDVNLIRHAVDRRHQEIDEHPDGQSEEARDVRQHVEDAASLLLDSASRLAALARHIPEDLKDSGRSRPEGVVGITEFDREVLGILMASGGWNSQSRARLMVIASQHGVTPAHLMNVLMGMTRWLRAGGSSSMPKRASRKGMSSSVESSFGVLRTESNAAAFDRFVDRWTPDFRTNDTASTARLSILFSGIFLLLIILIVGFLLSTPEPQVAEQQAFSVDSSAADKSSGSSNDSVLSPVSEGTLTEVFEEMSLPSAFVDASDGILSTTVGLSLLCEAIDRGEPASNTRRTFEELMKVASLGWFLTGNTQRIELVDSVVSVFEHLGDDIQSAISMMDLLQIGSGCSGDLADIPTMAFHGGVLGAIKASHRVSPSIREDATRRLASSGITSLRGDGFTSAALAVSARCLDEFLQDARSGNADELAWMVWMECVLALNQDAEGQSVLLLAVEGLVRDGLEVDRSSPVRNVLARILQRIEASRSEQLRDFLVRLYVDNQLSSRRLAVLTELMGSQAEAMWFDESVRVSSEADMDLRKQAASELMDLWPARNRPDFRKPAPIPRGFEPGVAKLWLDGWSQLESVPASRSDLTILKAILQARLFNQAASALVDGEAPIVRTILRDLEEGSSLADVFDGQEKAPVSTRAWGRRVSKTRAADDRLQLLKELETYDPGDLDTIDAVELAAMALVSPARIRTAAQTIILQRFRKDPELLLALVNTFPRKPPGDVIDFFSSLCGTVVDSSDDASWTLETRRLLIDLAMRSRASNSAGIELLVARLHESYSDDLERTTGHAMDPSSSLQDVMLHLFEARAETVQGVMSVYDTDRLAGVLQNHDVRYRLAEGPLQQSLIRSLGILDIMVLEWSIKMPSELESFEWIQQDLAYRLPLSSHMLVQILTVELAIGDIWRIVIEDYMSRTLDSESVS